VSREKKVSDYELERLLRGELEPAEGEALRARLRAAGEEGRLEALAASDREILARYAPTDVAREVRRRAVMEEAARAARNGRRKASWVLSLAGGFAAAAAVWFVVRSAPHGQGDGTVVATGESAGPEHIAVRGEPALHIFRRTAKEPEKLSAKTHVKPGDAIQLRYIAEGDRYGFIASVDARGAVNLHLPENGGPAASLEPSGERALPHSYELDDSPGFERFVFVSSTEPFDTRPYAEALATGKPLSSRPPVHVTELTLIKDTP
jgi:hypothetical protein